ncbi:hypothetical protein J4Q44_G00273700 [Coregonus suidteri]|uniref:Uncharacterized protein n=1 Tax=Coregonus suidteri TaxID=861788 RepID=A0AAN8L6X2_9TELE
MQRGVATFQVSRRKYSIYLAVSMSQDDKLCPPEELKHWSSPGPEHEFSRGQFFLFHTEDLGLPQGERRKRGRPPKHKKPQTDTEHQIHQAQSPTVSHPCLQPEDQIEAVTLTPNLPVIPEDRCQSPDVQTKAETQLLSPSSPVPEDRCQSTEATSEPPCPTLDLQSPNKGQNLSSSLQRRSCLALNMNSPEDSSSSSTQKTSDWSNQQTATPQPGPQGERRKRGRPPKHKKPQTDTEHQIHQAQSPTVSHPCLQPEDQIEAVTLTPNLPVIPEDRCQSPDAQTKAETQLLSPSSPVPEDRCQSTEATSEPPCPTLDLQSPNKGQSKNGPHLSSASVGHGDTTGPNVLITGGYRYSQATGARVLGDKPSQNDSITASGIFLNKCAKEQRTLCQSPQNLRDGRKAAKKSQIHKVDQPQENLSSSLQSSLSPTLSPPGNPFSPNTPKRVRGRPQRVQQQLCLSSTPGPHPRSSTGTDNPFSVSLSHMGLGSEMEGPQNASPITPWNLLELSPLEKTHLALPGSKPRGRPRKNPATVKGVKTQGGKTKVKAAAEGGSQTFSSEEGPPAKRRRRSRKGQTAEGAGLQSDGTTSAEPLQCSRPRFELQESDSPDKDTGDAALSSDLSIELSVQEDHVTSLTLEEEEEEEQEDEEDLPSFLNNTKPLSITEGICVWCKFRSYPFWPAMVKSVNHKLKKASIVFIDDLLFDKKRIRKGFSVALKTLKPFDCEEAAQLECKAREKYDAAIQWCLALIADYRIRIGCGFTGSFIEYFSDDISCPVRRRYPQGTSDLTFPSKLILEEQHVTSDPEGEDQEGSKRQEEERRRKLLPDRSKAARNRANEKLVDFIVRQRRVETHLLGVISGQQQSKWLRWFLAASRSVVDTYLEDEEQLDQVYQYLRGVYETAPLTAPCLADVDRIRLVLDVLLPEAIIYAIAGVDELSLVKAEDKYLKGPCLSKREREEFDAMIEQQMKMKASIRHRPAH